MISCFWILRRTRAETENLKRELRAASDAAELKRYRELEQQQKKWESRKERLLQQLAELQSRVGLAEQWGRRELSCSTMEEVESVGGASARAGYDVKPAVTSSAIATLRVTPSAT